MELIPISMTKLKIMLTAPDMLHYELQGKDLSCVDAHTRRAFRHVLDDAHAQIGFDTRGEKLFIQLYASRDGGCELFVTKLGCEGSFDCDPIEAPVTLTPAEESLLRRVLAEDTDDAPPPLHSMDDAMDTPMTNTALVPRDTLHTVILSVPDIASVISVCRRLCAIDYEGDSLLYVEETNGTPVYHLLLELPDGGFYLLPEAYAFLKEYGEVAGRSNAILYLSEHGRLLCPHEAVHTLGKL